MSSKLDKVTYDVSKVPFKVGITEFSSNVVSKAMQAMRIDGPKSIRMMAMHSIPLTRLHMRNAVYYPDDEPYDRFMGIRLITDNRLCVRESVYDTWLFGNGVTPYLLAREDVDNVRPEIIHMAVKWGDVLTGEGENAEKERFYIRIITKEAPDG